MEARTGKAGSCKESNEWHGDVTVLNGCHIHLDDARGYRRMGERAFQRGRSSGKGVYRRGVSEMITNIACYIIIAVCAASQFFMGAYMHVMGEMVKEYRYLLSLSVVQLTQVDIYRGVL